MIRVQQEDFDIGAEIAALKAGRTAIGAIVSSDSRRGARKGARIGAAVGATSGAIRRSDTYRRVYDDCMAGR